MASSSGSLNGTVFAAAIRAGCEREEAEKLTLLWRDEGNWSDTLDFSWRHAWSGKGLSDTTKLMHLLRTHVKPCATARRVPVSLEIVIAATGGVLGHIGELPATTYEVCLSFNDEDFDSEEGLEKIFAAAVASCSFPIVFAPTILPGIGPCMDGGVVNNTPLKYALRGPLGRELEALFVITPMPLIAPPVAELHGTGLLMHMAEMLINERLYRDLGDAAVTNEQLIRLDALSDGVLDAAQMAAVKKALGWEDVRRVDIVQLRPPEALPGDSFAALFHQEMREDYLARGKASALQALSERGWTSPTVNFAWQP